MLKRFESALGVLGMALTLVACQPPEAQVQPTEGEAEVVVRGLSSYYIDRMVVTAQPANVSRTLDYNADSGVYTGRLLLPAGVQTLTAEGYSSMYVPPSDGGSVDAGYPYGDGGYVYDAGSSYDAGYPYGDAGYVDAGSSYDAGYPYGDGGSTYDAGSSYDAGYPYPMDGGSTYDAGPASSTLVATGSATVTVVAGATTAVSMRIYDITPPPAQGDIGPLIRSLKSSRSDLTVGASTLLEVDAVDLDGDPLYYAWSSSCGSSSFSSPFSASTSWTSSVAGVCRIYVTVSSRGQSVTESLDLTVFSAPVDGGPGEGSVQVNGEYVARPTVTGLYFYGPGVQSMSVYRGSMYNATLPNVQQGGMYTFEFQVEYGSRFGTFDGAVTSDCGGTWTRSWDSCSGGSSTYCSMAYNWVAPATGSVCKVTARVANGTLTDSFSVGVAVR